MIESKPLKTGKLLRKLFCCIVLLCFTSSSVINPLPSVHAAEISAVGTILPPAIFSLPNLQGLKVYPDNPLKFDFIIDPSIKFQEKEKLKKESEKLIKYFLASLTVPEEEMWVNLSPIEKDRIIPRNFGITEMGRDMLVQDYVLKKLTASLMDPAKDLGKAFWSRVYEKMYQQYGRTDREIHAFNKVWIVPDKAVVYENKDTVFVVESRMKVMMQQDLEAQKAITATEGKDEVTLQIMKEIVIPEIEKEVNSGESFAKLRQIYNSLILATWLKRKIKSSILERIYVGKNKVAGVDIDDKNASEKIYQQYIKAFHDGVYEYVKDEYDPSTQEIIPRKYFSGGVKIGILMDKSLIVKQESDKSVTDALNKVKKGAYVVEAKLTNANSVKLENIDRAVKGEDLKYEPGYLKENNRGKLFFRGQLLRRLGEGSLGEGVFNEIFISGEGDQDVIRIRKHRDALYNYEDSVRPYNTKYFDLLSKLGKRKLIPTVISHGRTLDESFFVQMNRIFSEPMPGEEFRGSILSKKELNHIKKLLKGLINSGIFVNDIFKEGNIRIGHTWGETNKDNRAYLVDPDNIKQSYESKDYLIDRYLGFFSDVEVSELLKYDPAGELKKFLEKMKEETAQAVEKPVSASTDIDHAISPEEKDLWQVGAKKPLAYAVFNAGDEKRVDAIVKVLEKRGIASKKYFHQKIVLYAYSSDFLNGHLREYRNVLEKAEIPMMADDFIDYVANNFVIDRDAFHVLAWAQADPGIYGKDKFDDEVDFRLTGQLGEEAKSFARPFIRTKTRTVREVFLYIRQHLLLAIRGSAFHSDRAEELSRLRNIVFDKHWRLSNKVILKLNGKDITDLVRNHKYGDRPINFEADDTLEIAYASSSIDRAITVYPKTTREGRNQYLIDYILSEKFTQQTGLDLKSGPHKVVDIGVGFPPITTIEMGNQFKAANKDIDIIGVDREEIEADLVISDKKFIRYVKDIMRKWQVDIVDPDAIDDIHFIYNKDGDEKFAKITEIILGFRDPYSGMKKWYFTTAVAPTVKYRRLSDETAAEQAKNSVFFEWLLGSLGADNLAQLKEKLDQGEGYKLNLSVTVEPKLKIDIIGQDSDNGAFIVQRPVENMFKDNGFDFEYTDDFQAHHTNEASLITASHVTVHMNKIEKINFINGMSRYLKEEGILILNNTGAIVVAGGVLRFIGYVEAYKKIDGKIQKLKDVGGVADFGREFYSQLVYRNNSIDIIHNNVELVARQMQADNLMQELMRDPVLEDILYHAAVESSTLALRSKATETLAMLKKTQLIKSIHKKRPRQNTFSDRKVSDKPVIILADIKSGHAQKMEQILRNSLSDQVNPEIILMTESDLTGKRSRIREYVMRHLERNVFVLSAVSVVDKHIFSDELNGVFPSNFVKEMGSEGVMFVLGATNLNSYRSYQHPIFDNVVVAAATTEKDGIQQRLWKSAYGYDVDFSSNALDALNDEEGTSYAAPRVLAAMINAGVANNLTVKESIKFLKEHGSSVETDEWADSDMMGRYVNPKDYINPAADRAVIPQEIAAAFQASNNRLNFSQLMAAVNKHYYSKKAQIGTGKDFTTDAEKTYFGEAISVQANQMWEMMGRPEKFDIVEMGAGTGKLAFNLLEWAKNNQLEFFKAINYVIVDIGERRIEEQKFILKKYSEKLRWVHKSILDVNQDDLKDIQGVFLSNELVDDLPGHRVKNVDGKLREIYAVYKNGELSEELGELSGELADRVDYLNKILEPGKEMVVRPVVDQLLKVISDSLTKGFVITVDYGGKSSMVAKDEITVWGGVERDPTAHNIFDNLATKEITARVDFYDMAQSAEKQDLFNLGYTSQFSFLGSLTDINTIGARDSHDLFMRPNFNVLIQGKNIYPTVELKGLKRRIINYYGQPSRYSLKIKLPSQLKTGFIVYSNGMIDDVPTELFFKGRSAIEEYFRKEGYVPAGYFGIEDVEDGAFSLKANEKLPYLKMWDDAGNVVFDAEQLNNKQIEIVKELAISREEEFNAKYKTRFDLSRPDFDEFKANELDLEELFSPTTEKAVTNDKSINSSEPYWESDFIYNQGGGAFTTNLLQNVLLKNLTDERYKDRFDLNKIDDDVAVIGFGYNYKELISVAEAITHARKIKGIEWDKNDINYVDNVLEEKFAKDVLSGGMRERIELYHANAIHLDDVVDQKGQPAFADGSIGMALMSRVFELYEDAFSYEHIVALADEMYRILKPGGILASVSYKNDSTTRNYLESTGLWKYLNEQEDNPEDGRILLFQKIDKSVSKMDGDKSVGGIDFNPNQLKIDSKGQKIEFNVSEELRLLEMGPFEGFIPVIIDIKPAVNLPLMLGINLPSDSPSKAADNPLTQKVTLLSKEPDSIADLVGAK